MKASVLRGIEYRTEKNISWFDIKNRQLMVKRTKKRCMEADRIRSSLGVHIRFTLIKPKLIFVGHKT